MSSAKKAGVPRKRKAPAVAPAAVPPVSSPTSLRAVDAGTVWAVLRTDSLWPVAIAWLRQCAVDRLGRFTAGPEERAALMTDDVVAWQAGSAVASGWNCATAGEASAGRLLMYAVDFKRHGNKGEGWRAMLMQAHAAMDSDLELGRSTRRQRKVFGARGAAAIRKYTDEDRARWQRAYRTNYAEHSVSHAAELIAKKEGLPRAKSSIMKALAPRKKVDI